MKKYVEKAKVLLKIVQHQAELSNIKQEPRSERNVNNQSIDYAISMLNVIYRKIQCMKPLVVENAGV